MGSSLFVYLNKVIVLKLLNHLLQMGGDLINFNKLRFLKWLMLFALEKIIMVMPLLRVKKSVLVFLKEVKMLAKETAAVVLYLKKMVNGSKVVLLAGAMDVLAKRSQVFIPMYQDILTG